MTLSSVFCETICTPLLLILRHDHLLSSRTTHFVLSVHRDKQNKISNGHFTQWTKSKSNSVKVCKLFLCLILGWSIFSETICTLLLLILRHDHLFSYSILHVEIFCFVYSQFESISIVQFYLQTSD